MSSFIPEGATQEQAAKFLEKVTAIGVKTASETLVESLAAKEKIAAITKAKDVDVYTDNLLKDIAAINAAIIAHGVDKGMGEVKVGIRYPETIAYFESKGFKIEPSWVHIHGIRVQEQCSYGAVHKLTFG